MIFQSALSYCGLLEVNFVGYRFTWSNRHEGDAHTEIRLDRATTTQGWHDQFPAAKVHHLYTRNSDHMSILLKLVGVERRRYGQNRKRFRFEAMWLKASDCNQVVSDLWEANGDLLANLYSCRIGLAKWDKEKFGSVKEKVKKYKAELVNLQKMPFTAETKQQENTIRKALELELDREELLWKQRAMTQWLAEGDRNTRFFHSQPNRPEKN